MSATTGQQDRFHFLDGIRGIAAVMIVVHHAFSSNVAAFFRSIHLPLAGYYFQNTTGSGVDLFFVLSGVVLLRPYLRRMRKMNIGDYFWRRLKRIYPPYFVALVFGAIVVWFNSAYPTWYNEKGMNVQFTWLETLKEAGMFSTTEQYYNLAWWSLQIEILFYVLAPFIVLIFPAELSNRKLVVAIIITIASTVGLQLLFTAYFPHLYVAKTDGFMGTIPIPIVKQTIWRFIDYPVCFLLGVLLAAKDFNKTAGWLLTIAGALIIILSPLYWFIIQAGYGLLYGGILILVFNSPLLQRKLSGPMMIWLGERSYSLFLIHSSVFYLVNNLVSRVTPDRGAMYAILTRGIGIPLGLFAAMLLFWYVERRQARGLLTGHLFWPWQVNKLKG
ncbi:MAG: acyltransferase [Bacteroidota bacterium]